LIQLFYSKQQTAK